MKSKVAVFIDKLVLSVAVWLVTAYIFRYFVRSLALLVLIATAVTGLVMLLLKGKSKPKEDYSPVYEFMYMDKSEVKSRLSAMLTKRYKVTDAGDCLIVDKAVVLPSLTAEKVDLKTMVEGLARTKELGKSKLVVMTLSGLTVGAEEAVVRSEITVLTLKDKEMFTLCKAFKALPEKPQKQKFKLKNLAKAALARERARGYAATACMLLIFSLFNHYAVYYVVVAAICLTLSLLSRIDLVKIVASKR